VEAGFLTSHFLGWGWQSAGLERIRCFTMTTRDYQGLFLNVATQVVETVAAKVTRGGRARVCGGGPALGLNLPVGVFASRIHRSAGYPPPAGDIRSPPSLPTGTALGTFNGHCPL